MASNNLPKGEMQSDSAECVAGQTWAVYAALRQIEHRNPEFQGNPYFQILKADAFAEFSLAFGVIANG